VFNVSSEFGVPRRRTPFITRSNRRTNRLSVCTSARLPLEYGEHSTANRRGELLHDPPLRELGKLKELRLDSNPRNQSIDSAAPKCI
jgi:hypothetical protein